VVVTTESLGLPPVKKAAKRKSFQAEVNCQIRTTMKAGQESGRMILK
jgi:hypothetical protein